jgi:hypothetical protein
MIPTEDFIFNTDGTKQFFFNTQDIFKIIGKWEIDNKKYTVVSNRKLETLSLLLKDDGTIHNKIINMIPLSVDKGKYVTVVYEYKYLPISVKLKSTVITEKTISKGKVNYQLIYTGSSESSFFLTYREITEKDLARPSFFQNLTYSKLQKQIRFRNLVIQINSVDNEKVDFTVLYD